VQKIVIPEFEKPVIIRPKSTTDLRRLRNEDAHRRNHGRRKDNDVKWPVLRVEQDLEAKTPLEEVRDDRDFELWFNDMQEDLEAASLERYTYQRSQRSLMSRTYRDVLQARLYSCDEILSQTSSLLATLNKLKLGFSAVAEQTSSFQSQCDILVQEEVMSPLTVVDVRNNYLATQIN